MASARQRVAARKNIKKATATAKRKRTMAHLPRKTRTALRKQAALLDRAISNVEQHNVELGRSGGYGSTWKIRFASRNLATMGSRS